MGASTHFSAAKSQYRPVPPVGQAGSSSRSKRILNRLEEGVCGVIGLGKFNDPACPGAVEEQRQFQDFEPGRAGAARQTTIPRSKRRKQTRVRAVQHGYSCRRGNMILTQATLAGESPEMARG